MVVIVKVLVDDVPPPGVGVLTETFGLLAVVRSVFANVAVKVVELTNVVGRFTAAPGFHTTVEFELKLLPVTVSVTVGDPENSVAGEMELITGTGAFPVPLKLSTFWVVFEVMVTLPVCDPVAVAV